MARSTRLQSLLVALILALGLAGGASAVEPDEILSDPKLEARARALSVDLRCLVCQNQSIDDSNAPLARDLRLLVRERLKAGDTDAQVMSFVVARYGDFVLLRPPFNWKTILLWLSAPMLLVLVGGMLWRTIPGRGTATMPDGSGAPDTVALSPEEKAALDRMLAADDATTNSAKAGSRT